MKTIKFLTLGCKVNQYETQGLREQLLNAGFQENNGACADVYIINTCTVTGQADRESRQLIRKALRTNPQARIIATGCYAEKDTTEILKISDSIEIVPQRLKPTILDLLKADSRKLKAESRKLIADIFSLNISHFQGHERAFVKIQDGCNQFCSYCKVPLVRGRSRSRKLEEIIAEVKRLLNHGFKETVLTGICLGDYHYRSLNLANVVTVLAKLEGEFRLRLSSLEPQLVSDKLIEVFKTEKVCPHLHIPLQSGDDEILKKMNRRYTVKDYLSLITKIKKKIKDVAITTDVLVGFPGEEEVNFRHTISCLKEISPLRAHTFSFSPRVGTAAFSLQGRVQPQVIKERADILKEIAKECSYNFRKEFLDKKLTVLIEAKADKQTDYFCGYTENYIRVMVENAIAEDINNLVPVKVKAIDIHSTNAQK